MIRGIVTSRHEAAFKLQVRKPGGNPALVECVIDTGYTGWLILPRSLVAALGLARQRTGSAILMNGKRQRFGLYRAEIEWDEVWIGMSVAAIGPEPLVGMKLLAGHQMNMTITPGGEVTIDPLPPP